MTSRRVLAALLLSGVLAACAGASRPSEALARCASAPPQPGRLQLTLSPASFGRTLSLQQQVRIAAAGHTADLDAALDITPREITLVGLELGQRVLTLTYANGMLCEQRHSRLPAEVRGADILTDLQLSLWPVDAVRAALPPGWTLTDEDYRRVLAHDGRDVEVIAYDGPIRWESRITLRNLQYEYQLVIHSALAAP